MKCESCGSTIEEGSLFCEQCGARVVQEEQGRVSSNNSATTNANAEPDQQPAAFCENCGGALGADDQFCMNCGAVVGRTSTQQGETAPIHVVVNEGETAVMPPTNPRAHPPSQTPTAPTQDNGKSSRTTIIVVVCICVAAVLIAAIVAIAFICTNTNKQDTNGNTNTIASCTSNQTNSNVANNNNNEARNSSTNNTGTASTNVSNESTTSNTNVTTNLNANGNVASSSGYILPDSVSHFYTTAELESLSNRDLCLARNEIYARHGYTFENQSLQDYFNKKSWYTSLGRSQAEAESFMTDAEMKNKDTILALEKSRGTEYTGKNFTIE